MMLFNKNALRNKLQHYKVSIRDLFLSFSKNKEDVKTQNLKADEASKESFPASDPPGFVSTSSEDKIIHQ